MVSQIYEKAALQSISVTFVADAEEKILDLADKKKEDLQYDSQILRDISRLTESLKDQDSLLKVSEIVSREIEEKTSQLEGPRLINSLPIFLVETD